MSSCLERCLFRRSTTLLFTFRRAVAHSPQSPQGGLARAGPGDHRGSEEALDLLPPLRVPQALRLASPAGLCLRLKVPPPISRQAKRTSQQLCQ